MLQAWAITQHIGDQIRYDLCQSYRTTEAAYDRKDTLRGKNDNWSAREMMLYGRKLRWMIRANLSQSGSITPGGQERRSQRSLQPFTCRWIRLFGLNELLISSNHLVDGFIEFSSQWTFRSRCACGKHSFECPWEEDWISDKGVGGWRVMQRVF